MEKTTILRHLSCQTTPQSARHVDSFVFCLPSEPNSDFLVNKDESTGGRRVRILLNPIPVIFETHERGVALNWLLCRYTAVHEDPILGMFCCGISIFLLRKKKMRKWARKRPAPFPRPRREPVEPQRSWWRVIFESFGSQNGKEMRVRLLEVVSVCCCLLSEKKNFLCSFS